MSKIKKIITLSFLSFVLVFGISGCKNNIVANSDNAVREKVSNQKEASKKEEVTQKKESKTKATTTEEIATTSIITSSIDTSDWKTYRNEEYGFEVKYPNDLTATNKNKELLFVLNLKLNNDMKLPTISPIVVHVYKEKKKIKLTLPNYDCSKESKEILCVDTSNDFDFHPKIIDNQNNLKNQIAKYITETKINNFKMYQKIVGAELPQTQIYIKGNNNIYKIIGYNIPVNSNSEKHDIFWTIIKNFKEF